MSNMLIKENPLTRYKAADEMLQWEMVSKQTGISVQTLISVASKDAEKIGGITMATFIKLRDTLGVDLSKYYKNTTDKAVGKK